MDQTKPTDRGFGSASGGGRLGNAVETPEVERKPANAYVKMRRNATSLVRDAIRLADLQMQLFIVDAAAFWQKTRWVIVGIVSAAVVMLAAVIGFLFSFSEMLEHWGKFSPGIAKLIVSGGSLVFGLALLGISIRALTRAGGLLNRSCTELKENMDWLRSVMSQDDD